MTKFHNLFLDLPFILNIKKFMLPIKNIKQNEKIYNIKNLCKNGFGPVFEQCPNAEIQKSMLCNIRNLKYNVKIKCSTQETKNNPNGISDFETFSLEIIKNNKTKRSFDNFNQFNFPFIDYNNFDPCNLNLK